MFGSRPLAYPWRGLSRGLFQAKQGQHRVFCVCRLVSLLEHSFQSRSTVPSDQRVESLLDLKMATSLYGCGIWEGHLHMSPWWDSWVGHLHMSP